MKLVLASCHFFAMMMIFLSLATYYTNSRLPKTWAEMSAIYLPGSDENISSGEDALASESGELIESDEEMLIKTADARALLVANFIQRNDRGHSSPLQPYDEWGRKFVQVADEFGLDFRLLPAIARKESTFCKSNIAREYYNCFGYGVPASGITPAGMFNSYEEGMRTVAASLKRNYLDKGLTDPEAIMKKYCPPSTGAWANDLNKWLAEMRYDDKKVDAELLINADLTELIYSQVESSQSP